MSTKICKGCGQRLKDVEFPEHKNKKRMPDGTTIEYNCNRRFCHNCMNEKQRQRDEKRCGSEEQRRQMMRERAFKHKMKRYGLTTIEAVELLSSQNNSCKICDRQISFHNEDRKSVACIDHCHDTTKVRGILCANCNTALGLFYDDKAVLQSAIDYLICWTISHSTKSSNST